MAEKENPQELDDSELDRAAGATGTRRNRRSALSAKDGWMFR